MKLTNSEIIKILENHCLDFKATNNDGFLINHFGDGVYDFVPFKKVNTVKKIKEFLNY